MWKEHFGLTAAMHYLRKHLRQCRVADGLTLSCCTTIALTQSTRSLPSKQAVTAIFGKTGYALSWVARADRLGITPEELCNRFKTDSNRVKKLRAELTVENAKAADAK
jgi:hypothetical protein